MTAASLGFNGVIAALSCALSAIAAVVLFLGARHSFPELRPIFAAAGVLASIYCGGYFWLMFNVDRASRWSELFRPIGMLSWPVAWAAPALVSVKLYNKLKRAAGKTTKES